MSGLSYCAGQDCITNTGWKTSPHERTQLLRRTGKIVTAWAFEGDCDPDKLSSNAFMLEWPPHSGRHIEAPEVDRGSWYSIEDARRRLLSGQRVFLDRLLETIR